MCHTDPEIHNAFPYQDSLLYLWQTFQHSSSTLGFHFHSLTILLETWAILVLDYPVFRRSSGDFWIWVVIIALDWRERYGLKKPDD